MARVISYYLYQPSQPLAAVVCGVFGVSFLISLYQLVRYRSWVWIVMVLAVGMETFGYGARIVSAGNVTDRNVYIVQFCLVVLAPVLMAGVIYVVFGRIVFHVVPPRERKFSMLWVPPRYITPIFVGFDVFALFLQLVGAVAIAGTQPTDPDAITKLQHGKDIALAGVTTQISAFGLFTIVAAKFHFTSRRFRDNVSQRYQAEPGAKYVAIEGSGKRVRSNWRALLYIVNASCLLILVRSVYREIDFAKGKGNYLEEKEVYAYVLDALPMFIVCVSYNLFHPGQYLPYLGFRLPKQERGVASNTPHSESHALEAR